MNTSFFFRSLVLFILTALSAPAFSYQFITSTNLVKIAPRYFVADWTKTNGVYVNRSGQHQVIKSVKFLLTSHNYGIKEASVDLCLDVLPPDQNSHPQRNGLEQVCLTQSKSAHSVDWSETGVTVNFPGQGLLLPKGFHTFCSSGIALKEDTAHTRVAEFACILTLDEADMRNPLPPVQVLRTPYFDERFRAQVSSFTPHWNPTREVRTLLGVLPYIATGDRETVYCIDSKRSGQPWAPSHCIPFAKRAEQGVSPLIPLNFQMNFDDQFSSHCRVNNPEGSWDNICAAYFFISIPRDQYGFNALPINSTIPPGWADQFCRNPLADHYSLTNPDVQVYRPLCADLLRQTKVIHY